MVQQYLRPGVYHVTVQTRGKSRGRAGIHLRRTDLLEDKLTVDAVKKTPLKPDVALRYTLTIDEPGRYRLRTLGLGKTFSSRLEDTGGVAPNRTQRQENVYRTFRARGFITTTPYRDRSNLRESPL